MMATKALPEMEAERAQQAEKHQKALGALSTTDQMAALQVQDLCLSQHLSDGCTP